VIALRPSAGSTDPFACIAHAKKRAFLKAIATSGKHTAACRAVQISHGLPAYWRRVDARFAALERRAWDVWVRRAVAAGRTSVRRER
jgi:hypothetical protein